MRPWIPEHSGTHRHRAAPPAPDTKQPASRENPASGRTRRMWQVMGSNHRRLSRRFYSPILLSEAHAAGQRGCRPRPFPGPPPSAMRPCARGRWPGDARTGADGGVRRLRLHADLRRSRCLLAVAVFLTAGFGLGVLGVEGVGDALVGGVGPPVDAVGVLAGAGVSGQGTALIRDEGYSGSSVEVKANYR
jgi:hypothetical protein